LAHDGSLCNSRTTSSSTHLLSYSSGAARALLSFPTRRSSDLAPDAVARRTVAPQRPIAGPPRMQARVRQAAPAPCLATCACLLVDRLAIAQLVVVLRGVDVDGGHAHRLLLGADIDVHGRNGDLRRARADLYFRRIDVVLGHVAAFDLHVHVRQLAFLGLFHGATDQQRTAGEGHRAHQLQLPEILLIATSGWDGTVHAAAPLLPSGSCMRHATAPPPERTGRSACGPVEPSSAMPDRTRRVF